MKLLNGCEHYEQHVSTWLDSELDRAEQVELLDHLVRCEPCRGFYVEARALDGLAAMVREPSTSEASPSTEVWKRIAAETGADRKQTSSARRLPVWAMQAAAAIVIAFGLGVVYWSGIGSEVPEPSEAMVRIGEDAGEMTDARFVELTKEVLRSDDRYRSAMLSVMEQVTRDRGAMEASVEEYVREPEDGTNTEVELASRMPA